MSVCVTQPGLGVKWKSVVGILHVAVALKKMQDSIWA